MQALTGSLLRLTAERGRVDALNVFPVPDGDTGANMSMTLAAAVDRLKQAAPIRLSEAADIVAMGALMGARGNSGVILSQFFRGFAKELKGIDDGGAKELARALVSASDTAYQAVMKPVEGTMLSVGKGAATAGQRAARAGGEARAVLAAAIEGAQVALAATPRQLAVLRDAGVVDAGGQGLLIILEGAYEALYGEGPIDESVHPSNPSPESPLHDHIGGIQVAEITFRYCTEFLVQGDWLSLDAIRSGIESHGDSLLVVGGPEMVKVHIHTNHPGRVLEFCGSLGELLSIHINNMAEQNRSIVGARGISADLTTHLSLGEFEGVGGRPVQPVGVVTVVAGQGLVEIARSLGAQTVYGGQTMNPSTEELLRVIDEAPFEQVILVPNNKNLILTAEQAAKLSEKPVVVLPTRSIPEGIAAIVAFDGDADVEQNRASMATAAAAVKSGEVTYAVRDARTGDCEREIKAGDILGLAGGNVVAVGQDRIEVVCNLVEHLAADGSSGITLYVGEDVDESEAEQVRRRLQDAFPDHQVEVYRGEQPVYAYLISVE